MQKIFSDTFLSDHLQRFKISQVTGLENSIDLINGWIREINSGKIHVLKEEEIKSRFILEIFGEVLGFKYWNSQKWFLREEKKTVMDAKKPDAVLGYFTNTDSDVRAVIEMKDANTDLDKPQKRKNQNISPVQQAFGYAPDMGGSCKWVIVSNLLEIRFYHYDDRSKYERFLLADLQDELILKKFLFLFHKDRFIHQEKSHTERLYEANKNYIHQERRKGHILDQMYECIKKFDGLGFIDPVIVANCFPFNILNDRVWHYNNFRLFTLNKEIFQLLKEVEVVENKIQITEKLKTELEKEGVSAYLDKLEFVFQRLNYCLIYQIDAIEDVEMIEQRKKKSPVIGFSKYQTFNFSEDEGVSKNINVLVDKECDCLSCNYRSLDLKRLIGKLKSVEGNKEYENLEYGFGNYLLVSNGLKKAYLIYKAIEKRTKGIEGKEIEYFISKYNKRNLSNLMITYKFEDKEEIIEDIKAIDLDKILWDEIEIFVDPDVRKALIKLKDNALVERIRAQVDETVEKAQKLKELYDRGGTQYFGSSHVEELHFQLCILYLHVNLNYLVFDIFSDYKKIVTQIFKGLIFSYTTPNYEYRLKSFNDFYITEAILHINQNDLFEILAVVERVEVDEASYNKFLSKISNFLNSYFKDGLFHTHKDDLLLEYLANPIFKDKYTNIFSNLFIIFSKINLKREDFQREIATPLIKFIEIEDVLAWFDLKYVGAFIKINGNLFESDQLYQILKIAINRNRYGYNKYDEFIKDVCYAIEKSYPNFQIKAKGVILKAISSCISENEKYDYKGLLPLWKIVDEENKKRLYQTFEGSLDQAFDANLYDKLIRNKIFSYNHKDYFERLIQHINSSKGRGFTGFVNEHPKFENHILFNFILLIYILNIDFDDHRLKVLTNLSEFEKWLLNPIGFDYSKFQSEWILAANHPFILNKLKGIDVIPKAIDSSLKDNFNPKLAEIYFRYFA